MPTHVSDRTTDPHRATVRIVVIYLAVGGAWILGSDRLLAAVTTNPEMLTTAQTAKGWGFVIGTGALLAILIDRALARARALQREIVIGRERYRALFDGISDAVLVFELGPRGAAGPIVEVNRAAVAWFGQGRERLLGREVGATIAPEHRQRVAEAFARLVHEPRVEIQFEQLAGDGRRLPVELHATRFELAGAPTVVAIARDVSERLRVAEELVHSERLAAVGTLASGLAHEFNNLHAAMLGQVELGLADHNLPHRLRQRLEVVAATIERASGLTRNLLSLGRRRSDGRPAQDVRTVVEDTMRILRGQLLADGVELELVLAATPAAAIDRAQIGQVVMNLVINAWHALAGRPARRIRVTTGGEGDAAMVRVEDTGCGIAPEHLGRLFIPFFTTKGARAGEGPPGGTGLGLSVSHAIVRDHGGELTVASQPGVGTTFSMRLPACGAASVAHAPSAPTLVEAPARILVVDDDLAVRTIIVEALSDQGHEVLGTDDGAVGLLWHAERPFELVVMDLQMPKMGGTQLLARLRAAEPAPGVVVMTGRLSDQSSPAGIPGADAVLAKPFPMPELHQQVASALRRHRVRSPSG